MNVIDTDYTLITVSIEDKEYTVRERTEETESLLREYASKEWNRSVFENDMDLLNILLGKEAVKELFPKGKKENLNRLHRIAVGVRDAYEMEMREINRGRYASTLDQLEEIGNKAQPVIEMMNRAQTTRNRR